MSALQHDSTLPSSRWYYLPRHRHLLLPPEPHNNIPTPSGLAEEPHDRIVFTRRLWQRTMLDGCGTEQDVLNKSQLWNSSNTAVSIGSSRRTSSTTSSQHSSALQKRSDSSPDLDTTLTTEKREHLSRPTRKRPADTIEEESKESDDVITPLHAEPTSVESPIHVCICQPDPKIPRPRNAFILYRQHHQANVVAQNPGLSNPDISKIIGEQWQKQTPEAKNKWKALAEEEKIRHQQQYPAYRYKPKRSDRHNSLSSDNWKKLNCVKCGGKSTVAASTSYSAKSEESKSSPRTPGSTVTPVTRTLPVLRALNLHSVASPPMGKQSVNDTMLPGNHPEERDKFDPLSPNFKRRRFNGEQTPQPTLVHSMPARYINAPVGHPIQPGTPFPYSQAPPHPYPAGANQARRETLPGFHGVVSPTGPMAPPPRPGPGYHQHRLSRGHTPHDRSLTLPPLRASNAIDVLPALSSNETAKTSKEHSSNMDFRHKIHVLRRVAPPVPVERAAPRGPLVVVEGDNSDAAKELGLWLANALRKIDNLHVSLLDGPKLSSTDGKEALMAKCHTLAAEWLLKSSKIRDSLNMRVMSPTDSVMVDNNNDHAFRHTSTKSDEDSDDSAGSPSETQVMVKAGEDCEDDRKPLSSCDAETIDVDENSPKTSGLGKDTATASTADSLKPVGIITNYSLHASNFFATHIPIDAHDPYAPHDHWQWTATQWRGIISPDLTIYVCDSLTVDSGKQSVDISDEGALFVVKRTQGEGKDTLEIEPSTLRRLGFEVSEWIQAFEPSG